MAPITGSQDAHEGLLDIVKHGNCNTRAGFHGNDEVANAVDIPQAIGSGGEDGAAVRGRCYARVALAGGRMMMGVIEWIIEQPLLLGALYCAMLLGGATVAIWWVARH
jgi:hypothetical protein